MAVLQIANLSDAQTNITTVESKVTALETKLPFAFGIDTDSNYGYKKLNTDVVIPFD